MQWPTHVQGHLVDRKQGIDKRWPFYVTPIGQTGVFVSKKSPGGLMGSVLCKPI